MAGANPRKAVDSYVSYIEETLSVITADRLVVFPPSEKLFKVSFVSPARVRTATGGDMYISVVQTLGTQRLEDGNYKVKTRRYSYSLLSEPNFSHHGVISYHWHPEESAVGFPHLHIRITQNLGYPELERRIHRAHYPTSRVCLEDFILCLIRYYDVRARIAQSRWTRLLEKNKAAFDKWASWKIQPPR